MRLSELRTGGLCLSELCDLIKGLSPDSAIKGLEQGLPEGWSLTHVYLTDLYAAHTGQLHPARAALAERARAGDVLARLKAQQARLAANQ